ncbi:hypothetical protein D3C81_1819000 [compost metagenome]|jgi:hypothetical protein
MEQSVAVDTTIAEILGCVLGSCDRTLESFLEGSVDGFVALREVGVDERDGRSRVRLFIYDYLPLVAFVDDIRAKPCVYRCSQTVMSQLRRVLYDRFYLRLGDELINVPPSVFELLIKRVVMSHPEGCNTSDYFYL